MNTCIQYQQQVDDSLVFYQSNFIALSHFFFFYFKREMQDITVLHDKRACICQLFSVKAGIISGIKQHPF